MSLKPTFVQYSKYIRAIVIVAYHNIILLIFHWPNIIPPTFIGSFIHTYKPDQLWMYTNTLEWYYFNATYVFDSTWSVGQSHFKTTKILSWFHTPHCPGLCHSNLQFVQTQLTRGFHRWAKDNNKWHFYGYTSQTEWNSDNSTKKWKPIYTNKGRCKNSPYAVSLYYTGRSVRVSIMRGHINATNVVHFIMICWFHYMFTFAEKKWLSTSISSKMLFLCPGLLGPYAVSKPVCAMNLWDQWIHHHS